MAYEIIYQAYFDNVANTRYKMEILKKDYSGDIGTILFAGTPIKHSWQTDEPKPAIKGSSLILNAYNYESHGGGVFSGDAYLSYFPIMNINDIFLQGTDFIPEVGVPFTISGHSDPTANNVWAPLTVFTDVPGDWKIGVAIDSFTADTALSSVTITAGASPPSFRLIDFYSEEDDTFKCRFYEEEQLKFEGFLVQDDCTEEMADYVHEISLSFNDNLGLLKDMALDALSTIPLVRGQLSAIVLVCLTNTGLELETFIYANIFETTFTTDDSFLAQTYIDTQTFIKGEGFDNCHEVLTKILERFNLTLFQANGAWHIVRWDEIRYGTAVPYFQYDASFALIGTGVMDANFITGFSQAVYPEVGLMKSIFRPFKYAKETFNYVQPKFLLRNFDLQDLGGLITTYTDGPNTINEYGFTDWVDGGFGGAFVSDFFIRVITDTATGDEIERYVVIKGNTGDTPRSIVALPFEVIEGDRIEFDFSFKTNVSQGGYGVILMGVRLFDGTTTVYADEDPNVNWDPSTFWAYQVASGDNTTNLQSVHINPGPIPFDGLIYCYLPQAVTFGGPACPTCETQIRDIRITYIPYINDSVKIIGHIHTSEQALNIKNTEAVEIFIDDSPRNSIIGNLFLASFTGLLQDRTTRWYRLSNPGELARIGEITTFEQLFWRHLPRTKLEGTYYGVLNLSMLAILSNVALTGLNFIFGSLEIEYKNNNLNCTMWEIFADGEADGDFGSTYSFKYIYESK